MQEREKSNTNVSDILRTYWCCHVALGSQKRQYAIHVSNTYRLYRDVSEPEPIDLITLRLTQWYKPATQHFKKPIGKIISKTPHRSEHEWTRVNTNEHEWTRVNKSEHEWTRVEHEWTRVNTSEHEWNTNGTRMNTSEHEWTRVNTSEHEWNTNGTRMNTSEHEWTRVNMNEHEWTRMNTSEHEWNTDEHEWTRMENEWTRMNKNGKWRK